MKTMDFHPIAELFPIMEGEEFERLAVDIKLNGLLEPIWTYEGKILDGRNRWLACQSAEVEPKLREYKGHNPVSFVISMNVERRHLTPSQRKAMAVDALPLFEAEARERQTTHKAADVYLKAISPEGKKQARDYAAELFHTSGRGVSEAKALKEEAPELFAEMKAGLIELQEAKKEVHKKKAKRRQAEAVKEFKQTRIKARVLRLDIRDATAKKLGIEAGSVDAIISDPPYPKEFLPLFGNLAAFAGEMLRDGGSLIVMSGEAHLPDVFRLLVPDARLHYQWTMAYLTPGKATQLQGRPIASNWKPLIWLTKGAYQGARINDVFENPAQDKEHHEWGQGEVGMTQIIERMTMEGALVVDPFLGGGTTGVCCVRTKRRFLGFDSEAEAVEIARARIAKAEHDATKI